MRNVITAQVLYLFLYFIGQNCFATELSSSSVENMPNRPNILFILTDDQSHRAVSAYPEAHSWVQTPNIDRLAEVGVRFANAYVGTWCMASRVSLLTGRLTHGVDSMRMHGPYPGVRYDPEKAPFWPKVLRKSGYTTAHIGKWHIGEDTGAGRDWDYQASWSRPQPSWTKTSPETGSAKEENKFGTGMVNVTTVEANKIESSYYYLNQDISFNGASPVKVDGYATDNYTDWAEQFIRGDNRSEDAPWFLWLNYTAPHFPFIPAERHQRSYEGADVPMPLDVYPPRPGKPGYVQEINDFVEDENGQPRWKTRQGITLENLTRQYQETILAIDDGVGRLINALEETNQLENTLIIFTSDQGYALGQHGFARKMAPYDETIRGPLIISQPGVVSEGGVVSEPVGGVDLVPTILEAANMDLPWRMDGRNLWQLLRMPESNVELPRPMLLTFTGWTYGNDTSPLPPNGRDGHSELNGIPWYVMLRGKRFKYIRTLVSNETEELYDLNADPGEFFNLANRKEFQSELIKYRSLTIDELRRTRAPFVDELPPVQKGNNP